MNMMKRLRQIVFLKPVAFGPSAEASAKQMFQKFLDDFSEHHAFITYLKKHYGDRIRKLTHRSCLESSDAVLHATQIFKGLLVGSDRYVVSCLLDFSAEKPKYKCGN